MEFAGRGGSPEPRCEGLTGPSALSFARGRLRKAVCFDAELEVYVAVEAEVIDVLEVDERRSRPGSVSPPIPG